MDQETPIDAASRAARAAPEDETARLRLLERLLDAELFLLLAEEPAGETLRPDVFALEDGPVVLAFDREARLADFVGNAAPYAALSGRRLVAMIAGQGLGLGLNPGTPVSETVLGPPEIDWLAAVGADRPETAAAQPLAVAGPGALPAGLLTALDAKLAAMAGLIARAWLAKLRFADGEHLTLAFDGVPPDAQPAVAVAIAEAVRFSGEDGAALDVTYLGPDGRLRAAFERHGLRIDPPVPPAPAPPRPPGSDPDRPPILR
jgi:hypothetical protein